jgi:uncharacterized membrane protein YsdA (DUF1294 family)/cold shock CspA family protein
LAEQRGTLQSWNDQKGFGFIQPDRGGERLFVHISAMRGDARPTQGQRVYFVSGWDSNGRPRAEHMRAEAITVDRPSIRQRPAGTGTTVPRGARIREPVGRRRSDGLLRVRNVPLKLLAFGALCALPMAGSLQLLSAHGLPWALASHVLASSASFGLYWTDKRSAAAERRRVPEHRLHLAALLGGWPGALVAQQVFRHKTRKASFQVVFWAIVFVHQAFWAAWLLGDGHDLTRWVPLLPG